MHEHTSGLKILDRVKKVRTGVKAGAMALALVLVFTLPGSALAEAAPVVEGTNIYANGCAILVTEADGIIYDANRNGIYDPGEIQYADKDAMAAYTIYGGGAAGSNVTNSTITMTGGSLTGIKPGGAEGTTTGTTVVKIPAGSTIPPVVKDDSTTGLLLFEGNVATVDGTVTVSEGYTLDIGKDVKLTVPDGEELVNGGTLNNSGEVKVEGTLTSSGAINNDAATSKITVESGGEVTNSGTLTNDKGGDVIISNGGAVTNSGKIINDGTGSVVKVDGTLTNTKTGIVENTNSANGRGEVNVNPTGKITNNGTFNNSSTVTIDKNTNSTGVFYNAGGATLNNYTGGQITGSSGVTGTGAIGGNNAEGLTRIVTEFLFSEPVIPAPVYGAILPGIQNPNGRTEYGTFINGVWTATNEAGAPLTPGESVVDKAKVTYSYVLSFTLKAEGTLYRFSPSIVVGKTNWVLSNDDKTLTITYPTTTLSRSLMGMVADPPSPVTYKGTAYTPPMVVKDNGKDLTPNVDYGVVYQNNIDAGTATVIVTGINNYEGTVTKEFRIECAKVTVNMIGADVGKSYDGTMDATHMQVQLYCDEYPHLSPSASLGEFSYTAVFTDSADVGTNKPISVTVSLNNVGNGKNCVFAENNSRVITLTTTSKITKASMSPSLVSPVTLDIYNKVEHTYDMRLDRLLPNLTGTKLSLGASSCVIKYADPIAPCRFTSDPVITGDNKLRVPIGFMDSTTADEARGTIKITISSTNFLDFDNDVNLNSKNRETPTGGLTGTYELTYGDKLGVITQLQGVMKVGEMPVSGVFTWTDPEAVPTEQGTYSAEWMFTPAEVRYEPVKGNQDVTVKRRPITDDEITITISDDKLVYNGAAQVPTEVTVMYKDKILESGTDYTYTCSNNTDAGIALVTVEGMGNYTGTKSVDYTIAQKPIKATSAIIEDRPYDGTILVKVTNVTFDGLIGEEKLVLGEGYKANAKMMYGAVGVYSKVPVEVLLSTVETVAKNYCFSPKEDGTCLAKDFEITKKPVVMAVPTGTFQVTNRYAMTYYYNLKQLLPSLTGGEQFGTVTYEILGYSESMKVPKVLASEPYINDDYDPSGTTMEATAALIETDDEFTEAATIYVKLTSTNIDFKLPTGTNVSRYPECNAIINIDIIKRRIPVGEPEVDRELTFGEALNALTLSGDMTIDGVLIPGEFRFVQPTYEPEAGTHVVEWTYIPDSMQYAPAMGKIRVKVNPAALNLNILLSEYKSVYNGQEQKPDVVVKYKDWVVPKVNYDVYYDRNIYVGTAEVHVVMKNNYVGDTIKTFEIIPATLIVSEITVDDKTYDGNTKANVSHIELAGFVGSEKLIFGKDYNVSAKFDDANAGVNKKVSVSVILEPTEMANNYTIPRESANTTATVRAAKPTRSDFGSLTVANKYKHLYEYNLNEFLPALVQGVTMGNVNYRISDVQPAEESELYKALFTERPYIKGNILYIPIADYQGVGEQHDIAWVNLEIDSTNYETIKTSVFISTTDRKVVSGTVQATGTLTYGEKLETLPLDGYMSVTTDWYQKLVPGSFHWKDGSVEPSAGTYNAAWQFVPIEKDMYTDTTGLTDVGVDKATPAGTPVYNTFLESGHTIKETSLNGTFTNINNDAEVEGTLAWMVAEGRTAGNVLSDATKIEEGKEYSWMFIPDDRTNYETRIGTAVLWPTPTPTPEPEPTPTPTPGPTASAYPTLRPSSDPTPTVKPSVSPSPSTSPGNPATLSDVLNTIKNLPEPTWEKDLYEGGLSQPEDMTYMEYLEHLKAIVKTIDKTVEDYRKLPSADKASVTDAMRQKVEDVYAMAYTLLEPEKTNVLNMRYGFYLRADRMTPIPRLVVKKLTADDESYKEAITLLTEKLFLAAYDVSITQNNTASKVKGSAELSFIAPLASNMNVTTIHKPDSSDAWERYNEMSDATGRYNITVSSLSPFAMGYAAGSGGGTGGGGTTPPKTADTRSDAGYAMLALFAGAIVVAGVRRRKKRS